MVMIKELFWLTIAGVGLGVILVISGLEKQTIEMVFVAVFILLFLYVLFLFLSRHPAIDYLLHKKSFDSTKWKNQELVNDKDLTRYYMLRNLLKRYSLVEMDRFQIHQLLGSPSTEGNKKENEYIYTIPIPGDWFNWPEKTDYLVLTFEENQVIKIKVLKEKDLFN